MKVFISWSGERSKRVARALRGWIPSVFQSVEPWMSEKDIMAGTMWLNELMGKLEDTHFGIICVTPENQNKPWLHFEAGAIAKKVDTSRVCPYLFSLSNSQLENNPLTSFQCEQADEEGTKRIIESIYQASDKKINQDILSETFALWWPKLNQQLSDIPELDTEPESKRPYDSILEEVLELVRQMARGYRPLPPRIAQELRLQDILGKRDSISQPEFWASLRSLSPQEAAVLAANIEGVRGRGLIGDFPQQP